MVIYDLVSYKTYLYDVYYVVQLSRPCRIVLGPLDLGNFGREGSRPMKKRSDRRVAEVFLGSEP